MKEDQYIQNNDEIPVSNGGIEMNILNDIPLEETKIEINNTLHQHIKEHLPPNKNGTNVVAKNLSYYVQKNKKSPKQYLLDDISFSIETGKMVLFMGPPGSGKSVLLKVLSDRLGQGKLEGTLLFNNQEVDPSTHQRDTIYVPQEDKHLALLTVKETMEFSARCNMGESIDESIKKERVNLVLEQIGLSHTVNTIVGNEFFRGISGGQKHFESIGLAPLLDQPIAEFIQEVLDEPIKYKINQNIDNGGDYYSRLDKLFKESNYYQLVIDRIEKLIQSPKIVGVNFIEEKLESPPRNSIWYETKLCMERHFKLMKIMKLQYIIRFCQAIFVGCVVGSLFYNLGYSQADARNRFGLLYYSVVLHIWTTIGTVEEYYQLRPIYYDQRDSKYYRTFPFFITIVITKIPVSLIEATLFSIPCYWLAGFRATADSYFIFIFAICLINVISQAIFQCLSSISKTQIQSNMISPGYMLPRPQIPGWWIWLYYISPLHYLIDMVASNELYGEKFTCTESELIPPKTVSNFNLSYPYGFEGSQICPDSDGVDFLHTFGMSENHWFRWVDLTIIIAMCIFLFTLFFFGLKYVRFDVKKPPKTIIPRKKVKKDSKVVPQKHTMNGCYMTFEDLCYSVPIKQKNKSTGKNEKVSLPLLKNINGFAKPGLMALMGPSGAGKSTLLDVLSKRKNMGTITGKIMINNVPLDSINLTRFTGYVEQLDILSANLTIREVIEFSANCRLPGSYSFENKNKMIDEILKSRSVIDYFCSLGYQHDPDRNPADFILELSEHPTQVSPVESYKSSQLCKQSTELLSSNSIVPPGVTLPNFKSRYSAPLATIFRCLLKRCWMNHMRRPTTLIMRFLRAIVPALIVGTMFLRIDNDQPGARNKLAMIFLGFQFTGLASISKVPHVIEDRSIYYRESSAGTYPSILYLLSGFITDVPISFLSAFTYWIPFYFLTGMQLGDHGWKFFYNFFIFFLTVLCYDNLSMAFSYVLPTIPVATLFLGLGMNMIHLNSGFFIPRPNIPKGWIWMHFIVYTKYAFEAIGITELKGQKFTCPHDEGAYVIPISGDPNKTLTYCPINDGQVMIDRYGFSTDRQFYNALILSAFIIFYLTVSYISITFFKHMKR
eukprot:gene4250-5319_t